MYQYKALEHADPNRCDTTDPITGERVVNLKNQAEQPPETLQHVLSRFNYWMNFLLQDSIALLDIREFIQTMELIYPGLSDIFTGVELQQLSYAQIPLRQKAYQQITRIMKGIHLHAMIEDYDAAMKREGIRDIASRIGNEDVQQSINAGLDLWDNNLQLPSRNIYHTTTAYEVETQIEAIRLIREQQGIRTFAICEIERVPHIVAPGGIDFSRGVLFLRQEEEHPERRFDDTLTLVHEMTHGVQVGHYLDPNGQSSREEIAQRMQAMEDRLQHSRGKRGVCVIPEDAECNANEIELTRKRLGGDTWNSSEILQELGCEGPNARRSMIKLLRRFPSYIGGGGRKGDTYPPAFLEKIAQDYREQGYDIYDRDAEGLPVLVTH